MQVAVRGEHVQPFRIEQVNLVGVLAQGRKTGRVPGDVESSTDSFVGVEFDLRWRKIRLAVTAANSLRTLFCRLLFFCLFERVIGFLLILQEQLGQRLTLYRAVEEHHDHRADEQAGHVQQGPEPFPAGPPGIIENRLCHAT